MLLPLKKEYVSIFGEWIKFSPTFEDIKEIEEIINAEQPQKEKNWGCQDKWKHKNALTENEENLIKLVDSLLDEDFIVIFEKISEYRIKIYQSGIIEDIKFPFKKVSKFKDNKRNQFFKKIKDNYNMFPYFKKYCDKVFFYLDNEN